MTREMKPLTFVNTLPRKKQRPFLSAVLRERVEAMIAHEGQWLTWPVADTQAEVKRKMRKAEFVLNPSGRFEVTSRGGNVYARYVA